MPPEMSLERYRINLAALAFLVLVGAVVSALIGLMNWPEIGR